MLYLKRIIYVIVIIRAHLLWRSLFAHVARQNLHSPGKAERFHQRNCERFSFASQGDLKQLFSIPQLKQVSSSILCSIWPSQRTNCTKSFCGRKKNCNFFADIRWVNSRVISGQSVVCASAMMKTISMLSKVPGACCAGPIASAQLHRYVAVRRGGAAQQLA